MIQQYVDDNGINAVLIEQAEPKGTGHAVMTIEDFVGDVDILIAEFALLYDIWKRVDKVRDVFIDGKNKGLAPIHTDIGNGMHSLRLSLEGYYDWESNLLVEDKVEIPIRISLLKK